eukprot:3805710-Prymnesium_polylepis.1
MTRCGLVAGRMHAKKTWRMLYTETLRVYNRDTLKCESLHKSSFCLSHTSSAAWTPSAVRDTLD